VDLTTNEKIKFFRNLHKIGYQNVIRDKNRINLIKSFQRKYRQNLINGIIDKECLLMSKNLIKKQ